MKKILFYFTFLFPTLLFGQNFPGKSVELLVGKRVMVDTESTTISTIGAEGFYTDFDFSTNTFDERNKKVILYPVKEKYSYRSDPSELKNVEFKIDTFYSITPKYSFDEGRYFALEMSSEKTGKCYYKYDTQYEFNFPFIMIDKIEYGIDFYAKQIWKDYDKFEDQTTYYTPVSAGISFMKVIAKNDTTYYMRARARSESLVDYNGFWLIFDNGDRFSKPNLEISRDVDEGKFRYVAFFTLMDEDIQLLINHSITDKKIGIFDTEIREEYQGYIRNYLKALLTLK